MTTQFGRVCTLIVADAAGGGDDLSQLRFTFQVMRSDAETPNTATIRVTNMASETAARIRDEYTRVVLQAGYREGFGVVFDGSITDVSQGRERGTDTYLQIDAADGDTAYNYAVVSTTLAVGATTAQAVTEATGAMSAEGVTQGYTTDLPPGGLPRGQVMFGAARDYLRQACRAAGATWSIQGGEVQVVARTGTLPDVAVRLNSRTGLIDTPVRTVRGLRMRALLNPELVPGGRVVLDQDSVGVSGHPALSADGTYRILTVRHSGDTRGNDWYSDMVCIDVDITAPPGGQVSPE